MRCCLAVKKNGAEYRPIYRLISRRVQDSVKWIRRGTSVLILERQIEHRVVNAGTAAERRLGAELLHYQLFDRVVENSKTRANASLTRATEQSPQQSILRAGTPRKANARRKRFVIGGSEASGNTVVTSNHQSGRYYASVGTIGI